MKKIFTSLILLLALSSLTVFAQSTEVTKGTNEEIAEDLQNAEQKKATIEGLNSLNIPVDGLVGPGEKDMGYSMLQYMLGSVTVEVYDRLFNKSTASGTADGVVTGTTLLLAVMSGIGLMMLYTVMFYVVLFGLLFSNVSGKPFGERWSTPHLAIRSFLSLTLLQPMARYSGLNGGQVIILGLALVSMGFAGAIFRQINVTMLTTPVVNNEIQDLDGLFVELAQSHMCQATLANSGIVKTDKALSVDVEIHPFEAAYDWLRQLMWDQVNDTNLFKSNIFTYCVGPRCVCGKYTVKIPILDNSAINAEKWEQMQVKDFYGDWITQYMHIQGKVQINTLINNYLDPLNSPLNPSTKLIFDYVNDPQKSKNPADITTAAQELQVEYNKLYNEAWLKFKEVGYNFLNDSHLSVPQINKINSKMAEILSDTGFVTAGFAHYIWMQRQEKITGVYNTMVKSGYSSTPPEYENEEYLDTLDVDSSIEEFISYPIQLQSSIIKNTAFTGLLPEDFSLILRSAAKGETEDSAIGAFFNYLSQKFQMGLFSINRGSDGISENTPDPVMEMKFMGDTIFSVLGYGALAVKTVDFFSTDDGDSLASKLGEMGKGESGFFGFITALLFSALLTIAFTYSFVIPSIPFVMFTLGVAAYFAYLFAVLGGSTVWIATWALPDGHDVFGHGGSGWSMVATLMLKPTFMLIGLVLGSVIIKTMGFYVNSTFLPSMLAMNSGVNPFHIVGNMTIYATLMSVLVYKSYSLIFEFGELIFAMIGVNGQHASFFKASEGSQALTGLNTVAASKIGGQAKDAVGAMLKIKSRQAKTA
jgi:conjugal transfer/type IV secretion protein DotA/TraY